MPMPSKAKPYKCMFPGCDKIVMRSPFQLRKGNGFVFCGRAHSSAFNRTKIVERTGRPPDVRIERPCSCGCERMVSRSACEWRKSDKQNAGQAAYYDIQCHNRALNVPGRAYTVDPDFVSKKETRPCDECGGPVTRFPSDFRNDAVFCCHTCSNIHVNRILSKAAEVHKICANPDCPLPGREFTVMRSESFRKYCGQPCQGKDPSPEAVAARRASGVASCVAQGGRPSSQERLLGDALTTAGIPHEAQVAYKLGVVDFLVCGFLYVHVDGVHWHSYPDGTAKDRRQDAFLDERGCPFLRFWSEYEVDVNVAACIAKIEREIDKRIS